MKIVWFLPSNESNYNNLSASVWIRALQLFKYLEIFEVQNFVNDETVKADIAVFVRRQSEMDYNIAANLKKRKIKVILDLCVNYYKLSGAPGLKNPVTEIQRTNCIEMTKISDAIFCSSQNICDCAYKFNKKAFYIPDSIDLKHFKNIKNKNDFDRKKIRAIWSGVSVKANELFDYMEILSDLKIPLKIISDKRPKGFVSPYWFGKYKSGFAKWDYTSFPKKILDGEFTISPRNLTESYNQGHSFFKVGIFLSVGIPAIASPVPSYKELLGNGKSGAICDTKLEFKNVMMKISDNRDILKKWSAYSVNLMKKYSSEEISKKYFLIFKKILT